MNRKVYVSGMHSGQSPCPGVGIARSIRKAFPDITIVGVDHWQGSSGLHDSSIDEVMILPQWHQIDVERHARQVRDILDAGNLWISSIDMEVRWFAEHLKSHKHLLAPGMAALRRTEKPAVHAFEDLGFQVPEYISASRPDSEVHRFLRHNSWQCWLKSPYHDAKRISSWGSYDRNRHVMAKTWKNSELFVQRNVFGYEESIAFVAYEGDLLGAVHMEKRLLTPEGKTWAGHITQLPTDLYLEFKDVIESLGWNGGGEIEFVRDPDGKKWMIECNPRFPAWIFGSALSGYNLPARLIAQVCNLPLFEKLPRFPFFTRVVQEIPAKESIGLPFPAEPTLLGWIGDGKKGKGGPTLSLPTLAACAEDDVDKSDIEELPMVFRQEVVDLSKSFEGETPSRRHLTKWTSSRFEMLARNVEASRSRRGEIRIGYSLKTSPTDEHLLQALKYGFYAECISQMEVRRALQFGFKPEDIILNGPGKFWPLSQAPITGLHMLFCDSLGEFDRVLSMDGKKPGIAEAIGFRVRLPKLHSRFGNSLDDFESFQGIIDRVKKLKDRAELGFHFHMPSWSIGVERWMEALESLIVWCETIEKLTQVRVRRLDLGGGFFPRDLEKLDFKSIQETVYKALPAIEGVYFEPGRSLTQDGEVLVSRVLDVRKSKSEKVSEIVVDACIAELPLVQAFTHRVFYRGSLLKKGGTKILGRICMEDDVLSNGLDIDNSVQVGDLVIFGDAGGYERTMSYEFGRG